MRILDLDAVLADKKAPRSPKTTIRRARDAGLQVRATYAVGPWMAADLERVLEPVCPSLAVWMIRPDGSRARATWIRRKKGWEFAGALQYTPQARLLNATEVGKWIA